ncbi:MAG: hypothetical protein II207_04235, partial [Clostridia bacterium]|nr:hypothetical protein [Clostridia bacterium]
MTFEKKFAEFKKELEKRNASELPTDLAMQVTMTDEDCGGIFYIANIGGNFAVEPYDYVDNTVNIAATAATLKDLLAGKLDGPDAMFRGLIEVNQAFLQPRLFCHHFLKNIRLLLPAFAEYSFLLRLSLSHIP